jgi:hypothetical protein
MRETLWKNNINFVNDVAMIYVNFITIVIIVSDEKKIGDISFVPRIVLLPAVKVCLALFTVFLFVGCSKCEATFVF